jgi:hypothetical protein
LLSWGAYHTKGLRIQFFSDICRPLKNQVKSDKSPLKSADANTLHKKEARGLFFYGLVWRCPTPQHLVVAVHLDLFRYAREIALCHLVAATSALEHWKDACPAFFIPHASVMPNRPKANMARPLKMSLLPPRTPVVVNLGEALRASIAPYLHARPLARVPPIPWPPAFNFFERQSGLWKIETRVF